MSGRATVTSPAAGPAAIAGAGQGAGSASGGSAMLPAAPLAAKPLKNFGPPTLQSDTVVFQAAKIPLSSARLSSTPGSAVAPSAIVGGRAGSAGNRMMGTPSPSSSSYPRDLGAFHGAYAPHAPSPGSHARGRHPLNHEMATGRRYPEPPLGQAPPSMMQRRPRSPPRERGASPGSMLRDRPEYARQPPTKGEFTQMLMEDPARPVARPQSAPSPQNTSQRPAQRRQRLNRPPSADGKGASTRRVVRLTITVIKEGDKLGFGIRNDSNRKLKVSTLQSNSTAAKSSLKIGDTLLSVNGTDLTNLGFLEVIQQLKATKPGELVFDIERVLDDDDTASNADSASQQGETMDLDSPLSVAEKRFGPAAVANAQAMRAGPAPPSQAAAVVSETMQPPVSRSAPEAIPASRPPSQFPADAIPPAMHNQESQAVVRMQTLAQPSLTTEPPRKRPRPAGVSSGQMEMEFARLEKQHKTVLNALTLELKKERTEKISLEEKNAALRKRLQNMLIECDEMRVKASSNVSAIKEQTQRELQEMQHALQTARAQLRLQDRGPNVARTDSIVSDLMTTKDQLSRLRKLEMERATNMSNRYSLESRQAEREAHRTRDRIIALFQTQLREIARRNYNNNGVRTSGKDSGNAVVVVHYEGLRRLAFVKMFGLPCSYDWYTSEEYFSTALIRHLLQKQDEVLDIFGNTLCHEERAGLFVVAAAPMNVAYDPTSEKLTLSCVWTEQNQIRELARNFRF